MTSTKNMTLNEQDEMNAVQYSPEKFDREDLVYLRKWDYFDAIVPQDNIEGFND
jgi:hypothetical protein